jgi:hypothetical protein
MARIRTLKPELLADEVTGQLSHPAFRLFVGCILLADDYGNLPGNPVWLRSQVFWGADGDATAALDELVQAELLVPYSVRGQRYLHLPSWHKHQRVDHPGRARYPQPEPESDLHPRESLAQVSRESQEVLKTDLDLDLDLDPDSGSGSGPDLHLVHTTVRTISPGDKRRKPRTKPRSRPQPLSAASAADRCEGCGEAGCEAKALTLADYLRTELLKSKPDHRIGRGQHEGDRWQTSRTRSVWARTLSLMHRIDGRGWRRSAELVHYVHERQAGDAMFVVESATTLREKWDRIDLAERRARSAPSANGGNATELTRTLVEWPARPRAVTSPPAEPEPETPNEPQPALPMHAPTEQPG